MHFSQSSGRIVVFTSVCTNDLVVEGMTEFFSYVEGVETNILGKFYAVCQNDQNNPESGF